MGAPKAKVPVKNKRPVLNKKDKAIKTLMDSGNKAKKKKKKGFGAEYRTPFKKDKDGGTPFSLGVRG